MARGRPVAVQPGDPDRTAADARRHGAERGHQLRGGCRRRDRPALPEPGAGRARVGVRLALPVGAAHPGARLPVQPGVPVPDDRHRDPLRTAARGPHDEPAERPRHRRRRPQPERDRLRVGDRPRRCAGRRPRSAGGRAGARPVAPSAVRPCGPATGAAVDRPGVREPGRRTAQGIVAAVLRVAPRPVRRRAEPVEHLPDRHHPAARRRDDLVPGADQRGVGRAVPRRAVDGPRVRAHAAADAVAARAGGDPARRSAAPSAPPASIDDRTVS